MGISIMATTIRDPVTDRRDTMRTDLQVPAFKLTEKDRLIEESKPCHKEAMASLHCVTWRRREECDEVVENVKQCRKFWGAIIKDRADKGLEPRLPPLSERDKVAADYQHLLKAREPLFKNAM